MKKLLFSFLPMALLVAGAVSCNKNQVLPDPEPSFPETFTATVEPGGEYTFKFTPNYDWTVSIPQDETTAEYFRLLDGSQQVYTVRGSANQEASVTVVCVADAADYSSHSVTVSMTMNSKTEEVGTVTLDAKEASLAVYLANADESGPIRNDSYDDGALMFSYPDTPLANDGSAKIGLVWNTAYFVHAIKVEADFDWTMEAPEVILFTDTEAGSGNVKEYMVYAMPGTEAGDYTITIKANDFDASYSYTVTVPEFEAELNVYTALVDDYGWVYSEDGELRMSYSDTPLADGDTIELKWVEGTNGYMAYILVNANFTIEDLEDMYYEGKPEWLDIEEVNSDYATTWEYWLKVDESNYAFEDRTGELTIGSGDNTMTFNVLLPGVADFMELSQFTMGETLSFNAYGEYYNANYGMDVSGPKNGNVTTVEELVLLDLSRASNGWYQNDNEVDKWIDASLGEWDSASSEMFQTLSLRVGVTENTGADRSGVVYLMPKSVYDELTAGGKIIEEVLNPNPDELAHTEYVLCYVEQSGSGSGDNENAVTVTLNNQSSWYASEGQISFEEVTDIEDNLIQTYPEVYEMGGHLYRLTYNQYISDPVIFDYSGTISMATVNPWNAEWLLNEYGDGLLILLPETESASSGQTAWYTMYDANYSVVCVIEVVCNY